MPKGEPEIPNSKQPVGDKTPMKEPIKLSPDALELLRSAAIPAEFLKIAGRLVPGKEALSPVAPEDFPAPTETAEPSIEMPAEPREELSEPSLEVSVEPMWEEVPWTKPDTPPELAEEIRGEEGAETFYLTDIKLDLNGVRHMTSGLSVMAASSLYPIVINNLACCMAPQDGEGPGEEGGRDEGEEVGECVECRLICIIGSERNETLSAALQAAIRYYDSGPVKECLQIVKLENKAKSTASLYRGGRKWSEPLSSSKLKTEMAKPAGKGKPAVECFTHVLAFYHGESKTPPGTSAPVESFVTKDVLAWLRLRLGAPVRNLYLWSCYGSEKIDVTGRLKRPLDEFKKAMENLKRQLAKKRPNKCKCDLCVFTAPSVKIGQSRQALADQRQQLENLRREAQETGSEAAVQELQDSLKKLAELSEDATDETLRKLEDKLGSDEFPVPLGIEGNHLVTGQPEGFDPIRNQIVLLAPGRRLLAYCPLDTTKEGTEIIVEDGEDFFPGARVEDDPVLTVRGLNKALKETGLR